MSGLAWAGIVATVCALVAWGQWLWFCAWLVRFTGSSASLKDAAVVARSFRAPRSTGGGSGGNDLGPARSAELTVRNEVLAALPVVRSRKIAEAFNPEDELREVPVPRTAKPRTRQSVAGGK